MHNWQAYRVILRLHSPLHIGWGKVSYLQRARPYVTGRVLRGALVNRVGRNQNVHGENPHDPFRCVSKTFAQCLTFTYFYPALKNGDDWQAQFPWEDEAAFRRRFLSSYAATALEYPQQTAAEGLLYETEFLSPYTLDSGEPVYLMGYVFAKEECLKKYDWKSAFSRLQLGGERGYGWGETRLAQNGLQKIAADEKLFGLIRFSLDEKSEEKRHDKNYPVTVHLEKNDIVLAHADSRCAAIAGQIEPMVGREWHAEGDKENKRTHIGQHLAFNDVRFAPGSITIVKCDFWIGKGGYWQLAPQEVKPQ